MAAAVSIVARVEEAGVKFWQGLKNLGGAAKEAGSRAKDAVVKGDEFVGNHIAANEGSFGQALKGIAQQRPVTSALAATAVVGGTVYGAKKILGPHTQRAVYSANDNERRR